MAGSVPVRHPSMEGIIPPPTGCRGRDGCGMLVGTEALAQHKAHPAAHWSRPTESCTGMAAAIGGLSWRSQGQHPQF